MAERSKYTYNGPVFKSDQNIGRVQLEVWANSPDKAYSDMVSQVKEKFGYSYTVKVKISKSLIKKEELKYGKTV
jgi:hypothetical protein